MEVFACIERDYLRADLYFHHSCSIMNLLDHHASRGPHKDKGMFRLDNPASKATMPDPEWCTGGGSGRLAHIGLPRWF